MKVVQLKDDNFEFLSTNKFMRIKIISSKNGKDSSVVHVYDVLLTWKG